MEEIARSNQAKKKLHAKKLEIEGFGKWGKNDKD